MVGDKSNIQVGDTVTLNNKQFIVVNKYGDEDSHEKIDIIHVYLNHNNNTKALRIDFISPFSVELNTRKR